MTCRTLEALVHVSDATIYRPNDISSRYWPYRIVSISSRKNIEISIYRYRFDTFQYRRNDACSMLSYSLYIHPTERRLRPFSRHVTAGSTAAEGGAASLF